MTQSTPSYLELAKPRMRWWPRPLSRGVDYAPQQMLRNWLVEIAVLVAIAVSPIPAWSGISASFVVGVGLVHGVCLAVTAAMNALAEHDARWLHVQVAWVLTYNTVLCLALVVQSGDPGSAWWYGYILYTALTGATQSFDGARLLFAFFTVAPAAALPWLLTQGAAVHEIWTNVGLAGAMGGLCYYTIAATSDGWRAEREKQASRLAAAQAQTAALEREALARDLHDAVGSQLAIVAMYGDLLEAAGDDAEARADLVRTLRAAAQAGLGELRVVLNALSPEATTVGGLSELLRQIAASARGLVGEIDVIVQGDAARGVAPSVRLAVVRVAQEAVANAIKHGAPSGISLTLRADDDGPTLVAWDNGQGFDLTAAPPNRGLAGMRRRAIRLGGRLDIESSPGHGTTVALSIPWSDTHVEARAGR